MNRYLVLFLVLSLLVACGSQPTPTPDLVATQIAVEEAAHATMTAQAPAATEAPEPTDTPIPTASPSPTETSTATKAPTDTPEPTDTLEPTGEAWERFESEEYGVAFDYPARLSVQESTDAGWSILDEEQNQGLLVGIMERSEEGVSELMDMPLDQVATLTIGAFFIHFDQSISDFEQVSKQEVDDYGVPGALVRWEHKEYGSMVASEALLVRFPSRIWYFFFTPKLGGWFERTKESIAFDVPSEALVTAEPGPTAADTTGMGQRDNPVPFGQAKGLTMDEEKDLTVAVTQSFRGADAWTRIKKANRYNDPPKAGMEYLLLYVEVDYQEGPSDEALKLEQWDFRIISEGQILEPEAVVPPDPEFDIDFFPGASGGGWMAWPILEGDEGPLLVVGMNYDGSGGFYFDAIPSEPLPTNTPKPTPKPKPTRAPTPTPVLAKMGEDVIAGKWFLRVTDVQWHKALYFYGNADVAMGVWCVLFLDIQNQAPGTNHFGSLWWELHGSGGGVYDDDTGTSEAAWQFEGKDTHWDDLNPGEWAQIVMAFDVVEGAKGLQLYSDKLDRPFVFIGDAQPPQDR